MSTQLVVPEPVWYARTYAVLTIPNLYLVLETLLGEVGGVQVVKRISLFVAGILGGVFELVFKVQ
jgi:hypothetical protein